MHEPDTNPPPVLYDSNEYEVDGILTHKKTGKGMRYLVKWTGYSKSESTWEPAHHLQKRTISDYWKRRQ